MNTATYAIPHESTGLATLDRARHWLAAFPQSILQLGIRIGVGAVFFQADLIKYNSPEFTLLLFRDEYQVPLLPPEVAAQMAMIQELTVPILLFLGLATRLATLPMLGMIAVIHTFVYPGARTDHFMWAFALAFGVSGLLYRDALVMYDRETNTLWSHVDGRALDGPLLGETLEPVPAIHATWTQWNALYPGQHGARERPGVPILLRGLQPRPLTGRHLRTAYEPLGAAADVADPRSQTRRPGHRLCGQ